MSRLASQVDDSGRSILEQLIGDLEQEMKGNDRTEIDRKVSALGNEGSRILGQAESRSTAPSSGVGAARGTNADDVIDADFEDVSG